jgi:hypothetical protein
MSSLKDKVKELAEITAIVPEALQPICFEILLRDYLSSVSNNNTKPASNNEPLRNAIPAESINTVSQHLEELATKQADVTQADLHFKARKFMEKYSVSISELNNLFYREGTAIMPLYENLKTTRMSEAQIRIALLQALHNALADGEFIAQVENVRTECRDRKSLDGPNFAANFKNNASLFDFDSYTKETKSLRLSEDGRKELAQMIKELQ